MLLEYLVGMKIKFLKDDKPHLGFPDFWQKENIILDPIKSN